MNQEVQSALRDKADNWKVQNLENDLNKAKRELDGLEDKVRRLQNDVSNLTETIRELITLICSEDDLEYKNNQIENLKTRL